MKHTKWIASVTAVIAVCCIARPAYAYIDPATSSYIIQVIAGIVIACGAAIGIFWKKIRLFFRNLKMKNLEKKLTAQAEKQEK